LSNLVFTVDHPSAELIVRLNPHPDERNVFLKEWWAAARLKNVLVNGRGRIAAILDWENRTSTLAPEWELALALHDLTSMKRRSSFPPTASARALAAIAPVLMALNLTHYASKLERLTKRNDQAQLERCRARLKGALDLNCPCT
jgi:hypothetical protein